MAARHHLLNAEGSDMACDIERLLGIKSEPCQGIKAKRPDDRSSKGEDRGKRRGEKYLKPENPEGQGPVPDRQLTYRQLVDRDLHLLVWEPKPRKNKETRPAILLIHSGGWQRGNAESLATLGKSFADSGLVALSVEYRLVDSSTTLRNGVEDAFHALAWVGANAGELGIDPKRIAVFGGSAGGHLAACLGSLDSLRKTISPKVRPLALVLASAATSLDSALLADIGLQIPLAERKALSPVAHAGKAHPPTLLLYAPADATVPAGQQHAYFDRLRGHGVPCTMEAFPEGKHNFYIEPSAQDRIVGLALLFLRRYGWGA